MNEQDTVEWYVAQKAKAAAAKAGASVPRPPMFPCCGWEETEGHHKECVNFQPEGEIKTNRIVQHFPGYMDFDSECIGFNTLEELLAIPWVKSFSMLEGFYRYSADTYLMAELKDGYHWWCIGKLRHPVEGLPKWEAKYKEKQ